MAHDNQLTVVYLRLIGDKGPTVPPKHDVPGEHDNCKDHKHGPGRRGRSTSDTMKIAKCVA